MLNVKRLVDQAIKTLRQTVPDSLYIGSLISVSRAVNPLNNTVTVAETSKPVEIIQDSITEKEIDGINILATDFKLHVIASADINVDFYNEIVAKFEEADKRLSIIKKTNIVIGSSNLMFTIVAR